MDMQNVSNLVIPEGEVRTIHDENNRLLWGRVSYDVKYNGNTLQNGTPSPDAPVAVQVATGEQTITVTEKNMFNGLPWRRVNTGSGYPNPNPISYASTIVDSGVDYIEFTNIANYGGAESGFIPVASGQNLTLSFTQAKAVNRMWITQYDNAKTRVATLNTNPANVITTTVVATQDGYITIAFGNTTAGSNFKIANVQVEHGTTATAFEPYNSQPYTVDFGSTELCKIGSYQDYIYKSGNDWYVHKETGKVVLDGTEDWSASNTGFLRAYNSLSPFYNLIALGEPSYQSVCDHFVVQPNGTTWTGRGKCGFNSSGAFWVMHTDTSITTAQQFKNWLASNNTAIYIPIATSTEAQITDTTLISQLEMVHQFATRYGYNANGTSAVPIIISRSDL